MSEVYEDTIAAVSTAMAPGGIGIVRISGKEAFSVGGSDLPGKKRKKTVRAEGEYRPITGLWKEKGERIDEVLAVILKGPHSYTGEDTVEIDCHGGVLAMKRILEAAFRAGSQAGAAGGIYQESLS